MDPLILAGLIVLGIAAGLLGGIFGLGGGIVFVPVLLLIFHLTPSEAAATSLIGIIAGSAGASAMQIDSGHANIRLGLFLEIATAIGAVAGAAIAVYLDDIYLLVIFAAVLVMSGYRMATNKQADVERSEKRDGMFDFSFKDDDGKDFDYSVKHIGGSVPLCIGAGMISSITGVGGGTIKVPLMNLYMGVPIKVATATSSYMIGITAFTGAVVYIMSGVVNYDFAVGIAIGAFAGSMLGVLVSRKLNAKHLKRYFGYLLFAIAVVILLQAGGVL